jgi:hypothetical protein
MYKHQHHSQKVSSTSPNKTLCNLHNMDQNSSFQGWSLLSIVWENEQLGSSRSHVESPIAYRSASWNIIKREVVRKTFISYKKYRLVGNHLFVQLMIEIQFSFFYFCILFAVKIQLWSSNNWQRSRNCFQSCS